MTSILVFAESWVFFFFPLLCSGGGVRQGGGEAGVRDCLCFLKEGVHFHLLLVFWF